MHLRRNFLQTCLPELTQTPLGGGCSFPSLSSSSSFQFSQVRPRSVSTCATGCRFVSVHRHVALHTTLLSTYQRSSLHFCTLLCARRFNASSPRRAPTFSEVSEACHILGVEVDCDQRHLKRVYRDLVRKNHPDAGGDEAMMSRITVAYDRLRGMSKIEREQFKLQKDTYRGGSYYATRAGASSSGSSSSSGYRYQSPAGYGAYNTHASNGTQGFYDSSFGEYFRQGPMRSQGFYNYQQRQQKYTENPFSSSHPFGFHAQLRRAWSMPVSSILLRGLVMYLGVSILLLLVYRQYRDWLHDDGWKMSESLARYEQISELHRLRQEMNERIRSTREAAAAQSPGARVFAALYDENRDYNSVVSSREKELRALEYARRRQMELGEEAKGWPQFTEDKGRLIRRAKDPPGVVFFEPRKEDLRYRQLRNMQTGREWSDKKQNAKNMSDKEPSNEGHALATPVATTQPGVTTTTKINDSTVNNAASNTSTASTSKNTGTSNGNTASVELDGITRIKKIIGDVFHNEQKATRNE
ncbi:hypothetical protein C3747_15g200 [Trypanosoma cruzi]|uniref:J domain-containing protein n=2 Tax=Trypanosoma cruzi TaxID=5693 RepID=Q4DHI2_TRYCC|nr:hypothetical protein, conserved [Trypanosoma cruzi]EAN91988.1 hypothetical protein, conserved [Trypanosoma cruzi]PWV18047.1 hypothetical protein C3747_15g200 [Trypanosoma cruzi]RNC59849.1 chaperone protein DNAJ [Trypanosoma cruzi]|eukprot:XP_813839.1 hypothetical protein [Trypanosoma cruzi strain CL Brener]